MDKVLVALFVLAVLIFVHELGHFLVAKWCGVGVLEFAIGFWKKVFSFRIKETNYCLRLVPLGGFVRMAGDDPRLVYDRELAEAYKRGEFELGGAASSEESKLTGDQVSTLSPEQVEVLKDQSKWFLNKGYWQKFAIVFAGPLFNILFALFASIGALWVWGSSVPVPVIGEVVEDLPAAKSGLRPGDRVTAIDGNQITSWMELALIVARSDGKPMQLSVERPQVAESSATPSASLIQSFWKIGAVTEKSIEVTPSGAVSDLTLTVQGVPASQAKIEGLPKEGEQLKDGKVVMPDGTSFVPMVIGVKNADIKVNVGFSDAVLLGAKRCLIIFSGTVYGLYKMAVGDVSTDNIRGPIFIFDTAAKTAEAGFEYLLNFMIFLSMSLAILNLLPIPVLDGGHLLFFTIEAIKGSPISMRFRELSYQFGMVVLMLLMAFAIGNDLVDLLKF